MTPEEKRNVVPRVCIIGGKAAPGYEIAKKIIKLVNAVGVKINNDGDIGNLLKVVSPSLPYHVSIQHMAKLVYYALKTINSFFPFNWMASRYLSQITMSLWRNWLYLQVICHNKSGQTS